MDFSIQWTSGISFRLPTACVRAEASEKVHRKERSQWRMRVSLLKKIDKKEQNKQMISPAPPSDLKARPNIRNAIGEGKKSPSTVQNNPWFIHWWLNSSTIPLTNIRDPKPSRWQISAIRFRVILSHYFDATTGWVIFRGCSPKEIDSWEILLRTCWHLLWHIF